tara:strand:- start:121 stop:771 length:651 start_codon:yes stop_codon:yes gene_type:complete
VKRIEKAQEVSRILNRIYRKVPIPLKHKNKFELVVAVLLSAQCTDERVNQVTPSLFKKANTAIKMTKVPKKTIYNIIRPCGLAPQKSKAIFELSRILVKKFKGKVPESFEELEKLPGVGHKTASVVMSQGFGHPAFPVDTHIHRLSQRWGLTNGKNVVQTEKDLKDLFPKKSWNKLHLQIIFYGREFCQARSCYGLECEICKICNPGRKTKIITKK